MKNTEEIIERLERLKRQVDSAIDMVKTGPMFPIGKEYRHNHDTPRTFEIGDFIVTDRHWDGCCGPRGCK